jgi:hypothetical protein
VNAQQSIAKFGRFKYTARPLPGDHEHIVIDPAWVTANIVSVAIPWQGRKIQVHRLAAPAVLATWQAWADAGLLDRVLTFGGAWVPRYKRGRTGSDDALSNHAWGAAFDINASWNPLGGLPAPLGNKGCVLELVPLAKAHGLAWGGDFVGRVDGMHFECTP